MTWKGVLAIIMGLLQTTAGVGLLAITVPNLVVMAQIEGWVPGARHQVVRVVEKAAIASGARPGFWISWGQGDVQVPGNHRLDLRESEWRSIMPGDPIEVIYAGTGRFNAYRRGGVFTEPGNFVLDGVLLILEMLAVWYGVRRVHRALKPSGATL